MNQYSDFLITILTSVSVSSLLSGFLLFITKSWISERLKSSIKSEYDQKLETHKAKLKANTQVEVEQLKAQLQIFINEHEVRYTQLYEKRAEIIAETYSRLKHVHASLGDYVSIFEMGGIPSREERRRIATDAHDAFRSYYSGKLIFFPKKTAELLEKIDIDCVQSFNEFIHFVDEPSTRSEADLGRWIQISERVRGDIAEALINLENIFRKLLGDEESTKPR